jgi:hypothetical protein
MRRHPRQTGRRHPGRRGQNDRRQGDLSPRIGRQTLSAVNVMALDKRVGINDVILDAIEKYLALHERGDVA